MQIDVGDIIDTTILHFNNGVFSETNHRCIVTYDPSNIDYLSDNVEYPYTLIDIENWTEVNAYVSINTLNENKRNRLVAKCKNVKIVY